MNPMNKYILVTETRATNLGSFDFRQKLIEAYN